MKFPFPSLVLAVSLALVAPIASASDLIKGAPKLATEELTASKTAHANGSYVVLTKERKGEVGEEITAFQRPAKPSFKAPLLQGAIEWMTLKDRDANYFAGLVGSALLVVAQTGPDGTLKVYNLATKKQVLKAGFHEGSARIVDGKYLEFEKLLQGGLTKLSPAEAKANPTFAKWLAGGGSAGRFQKVRLDLMTFQQQVIGSPVLREMQ